MQQDDPIEIRLVGENLSPYTVSARDAGRLIAAMEQILTALVRHGKHGQTFPEEGIVLGLAAIEQGSYILRFTTPYPEQVMPAYRQLGAAIHNAEFTALPSKSIEGLREVRAVARKYHANAEFWQGNRQRHRLATVTPNTAISKPRAPRIEEQTTLYGTVLRVGGDHPPRAQIRFLSGQEVHCRVTERDNLRVARMLGQRLYETVGLFGQVRWDGESGEIVDFRIDDVTNYRADLSEDVLAKMRQRFGKYYQALDDIDRFVAEMRGRVETAE